MIDLSNKDLERIVAAGIDRGFPPVSTASALEALSILRRRADEVDKLKDQLTMAFGQMPVEDTGYGL